MRRGGEDIVNSLSGKVSADALTELKSLMDAHKVKMDALRTSGTTDKTAIEALRAEQKTAMDALMVKYPELKTAFESVRGGRGMDRDGSGQVDQLFAGVSDTDKAALKTIRDEYKAKIDALRTEEKTKTDAIIAKYPEIKTKLDTLEKERLNHEGEEGMGMGPGGHRGGPHMGREDGKNNDSSITQSSTQAQ